MRSFLMFAALAAVASGYTVNFYNSADCSGDVALKVPIKKGECGALKSHGGFSDPGAVGIQADGDSKTVVLTGYVSLLDNSGATCSTSQSTQLATITVGECAGAPTIAGVSLGYRSMKVTDGLSAGAIAGIVIGVLAFLGIVGGGVWYMRKNKAGGAGKPVTTSPTSV